MKNALLTFTPRGIYCKRADTYIDPWKPVHRAIITHGHADHARYGNANYLAHKDTCSIMKVRLGANNYVPFEFGDSVYINGVKFSFFPAGHLLGSAQIKVEYKGEIWVSTGDYKLENDLISLPWEPIKCHSLITECTFGLPVYNWESNEALKIELVQWIQQNRSEGLNSVLIGYSLGKAQRLLKMIEDIDVPIYCHGAVENMNEVHRQSGIILPPTFRPDSDQKKFNDCIIVAPTSVMGTPWLRKFKPYKICFASGWMALRGARRRKAVDKGLIISDHVDWKGLKTVMETCEPEKVICTHGYTDIYAAYLNSVGIEAVTEKTHFETDNED